jgi:RHS repeat-associated protein
LEVIQQNHVTPASEVENDIYYYHTDHLGSSSWITYTDGSVTQHLQNLPFGEPFIDQRATSYDIRFKFTGKEMDLETGYQYFGARYYNSDISVWLSVDPIADKYPMFSPYTYVFNNPINKIDRWGLEGEDPERFGLGKRLVNWVRGDKHINKANKFAVKNNIKNVEIDENNNVTVRKSEVIYNKETNYNGIVETDYVFTKERILVEERNSTIPDEKYYSIKYSNFKGLQLYGNGPGRDGYTVGQKGEYFEAIDFNKFMEYFKPKPFIIGGDREELVPRLWTGNSKQLKNNETGKYYEKGDTMGMLPAYVKDSVKHYEQKDNRLRPVAIKK